jgi:hypothetical protein
MTRDDFLRAQRDARRTLKKLARIFPGAFDKNGKAIVAVAAFPVVGKPKKETT